jgi:tetratricopeptide (TPR) repeat protein
VCPAGIVAGGAFLFSGAVIVRLAIIALVAAVLIPAYGAAQTDPNAEVHYRNGLQLMSSEHWDDAAEAFTREIDLDPKFALAYYWLGRARIAGAKYVAAIAALQTCRELYLQEQGLRASDQLAANTRRQDQLREIRELIRERQRGRQSAANDRVVMHLEMLEHEIESQQSSGSSMDFRLSVPAFVSLSLGSAYFRKGELGPAEEHYRAALEANPKMGEAHNNLAVVLMMTGRIADAEREASLAEKSGFRVNPEFKDQLKAARKK